MLILQFGANKVLKTKLPNFKQQKKQCGNHNISHLCLFHLSIWRTLQSSHTSTQIWCLHVPLFIVSSEEKKLQWTGVGHITSCTSWFILSLLHFVAFCYNFFPTSPTQWSINAFFFKVIFHCLSDSAFSLR